MAKIFTSFTVPIKSSRQLLWVTIFLCFGALLAVLPVQQARAQQISSTQENPQATLVNIPVQYGWYNNTAGYREWRILQGSGSLNYSSANANGVTVTWTATGPATLGYLVNDPSTGTKYYSLNINVVACRPTVPVTAGFYDVCPGTQVFTANTATGCNSNTYTYNSTDNTGNPRAQPSPDVYYEFTLSQPSQVTINTCGSDFDTYLHLVASATNQTWDDDDSGNHTAVGCNGNTSYLSSLPKTDSYNNTLINALPAILPTGRYVIIAEGYSTRTGNLRLSLTVTPQFNPTITLTSSPALQPGNVVNIIKGSSATLTATAAGASNFTWATSSGVSVGSGASLTVTPTSTTTYVVTVRGCNNSAVSTAQVTVQVGLPNYITVNTVLIPGKLTAADVTSMSNFDVATGSEATANAVRQQQTTYFDGLGRPMQQVQVQASTSKQDIITPITYDPLGRTAAAYLPYTGSTATGVGTDGAYQADALAQQAAFYVRDKRTGTSEPDRIVDDTKPVAQTIYEASPLSRVLEQGAAGTTWQPGTNHTVKFQQRANTIADGVRQWSYDLTTKTYSSAGTYAAGQLVVKETLDEQNQLVSEYVDKQGKTVLRRVSLAPTTCNIVSEGNGPLRLDVPVGSAAGTVFTSIRRAVFGRLITSGNCADAVFDPAYKADVTAYVQQLVADGKVVLQQPSLSVPIDYSQLGPDPYPGSTKHLQVEATYAPAGTSTDLLTYYVYDDIDNLRLVIQPEGYKELVASGSWVRTATDLFIRNWCFQYDYDEQHRVISKQTPGASPIALVYNQRNQVVLTQDGNQSQLATPEWSFTKYDGLGRPIMTGFVVIPGATQASLQATLKTETILTEAIDPASADVGYTLTQAFPRTTGTTTRPLDVRDLLAVTYYDNYKAPLLAGLGVNQSSVRGLLTGTSVRIMLPDGTIGDWLTSATYYDKYYRPVQTKAQNHLAPGAPGSRGITTQTMVYDFAGKLLSNSTQITRSATSAPSYADTKSYTYDAAGRLEATTQVTGNQPKILLVKNSYNEIGQLIAKRLHSTDNTKFLQKVDYRYNIRGWLTHINDRKLTNGVTIEGHATDPDGTQADPDLFALELRYNNLLQAGASAQYNGNIAQAMWQTRSLNAGKPQNNLLRAYNYSYDPANRITSAQYTTAIGSGWDATSQPVDFSVSGIQYDGNGNLLKMTRMGTTNGSDETPNKSKLDELTYSYTKIVSGQPVTSNQLLGVDDAVVGNLSTHDFKDNGSKYTPSGTAEYSYDGNGSLTKDANKGITRITYTRLNQPSLITFATGNTIRYSYTATGAKLRKEVYTGVTLTKTTDYVGPTVFENAAPVFAQTGEGRVLYLPNDNGSLPWKYEYHLKDHLGNLRFAFRADREQGLETQRQASMEMANASQEERQFQHMAETRLADPAHARTGNYVARLNARSGQPVGPSIRLQVAAGDSVRAEVFGRYDRGTATGNFLQKGSLIIGGTTTMAGGQANGDPLQPARARRQWFPFLGTSIGIVPQLLKLKKAELPTAYIRYELFNKDSQLVAVKTQAIKRTNVDEWQQLETGTKVDSAGFVHVSLVNESGVAAYFDDMTLSKVASTPYQENHYDPFGLNLVGIEQAEVPNSAFQYNGKEKQEELSLNWTDYGARMYDMQLGRWHSTDPLGDKFSWQTPYAAMDNNPILKNDPTGMAAAPVYSQNGNFLGTDDQGLQGKAIIMNESKFKQGMKHNDALANNEGVGGLKDMKAVDKFVAHYDNLSSRPDYDGFLSIDEGVSWAKSHPDALANPTSENTLYLDAAMLDFGSLSMSDFKQFNTTYLVSLNSAANFFDSSLNARLRGTVYALGQVHMQLLNRIGSVKIINDETTDYNWDTHGSLTRRSLIYTERQRASLNDSHGFKTYYYGTGQLHQ